MQLDLTVDYERQIYLNARDCTLVRVVRKILRPGDTFVDAGANLGLLTLVAAQRVAPSGKVFAFEPSVDTFARLEENIRVNRLRNVQASCLGLWDERQEMKLYRYEGESHDTATLGSSPGRAVGREEVIQTVPLDEVIDAPVRLLKIDVEGAERFAVKGAERLIFEGPTPHLVLEVNAETTKAFGYDPGDLVSEICERRPEYRLHLLRTKSVRRITVEGIREFLRSHPRRAPNVWFEPRKKG